MSDSPTPRPALLLLLLLSACETEPASFADCAGLSELVPREDCRLAFAKQALDDPEGLRALVASVEDPAARDLLINRLAKTDPRRAGPLCEMTSTPEGGAKCQSTVGRPHLTAPRPGEGPAPGRPEAGGPPARK